MQSPGKASVIMPSLSSDNLPRGFFLLLDASNSMLKRVASDGLTTLPAESDRADLWSLARMDCIEVGIGRVLEHVRDGDWLGVLVFANGSWTCLPFQRVRPGRSPVEMMQSVGGHDTYDPNSTANTLFTEVMETAVGDWINAANGPARLDVIMFTDMYPRAMCNSSEELFGKLIACETTLRERARQFNARSLLCFHYLMFAPAMLPDTLNPDNAPHLLPKSAFWVRNLAELGQFCEQRLTLGYVGPASRFMAEHERIIAGLRRVAFIQYSSLAAKNSNVQLIEGSYFLHGGRTLPETFRARQIQLASNGSHTVHYSAQHHTTSTTTLLGNGTPSHHQNNGGLTPTTASAIQSMSNLMIPSAGMGGYASPRSAGPTVSRESAVDAAQTAQLLNQRVEKVLVQVQESVAAQNARVASEMIRMREDLEVRISENYKELRALDESNMKKMDSRLLELRAAEEEYSKKTTEQLNLLEKMHKEIDQKTAVLAESMKDQKRFAENLEYVAEQMKTGFLVQRLDEVELRLEEAMIRLSELEARKPAGFVNPEKQLDGVKGNKQLPTYEPDIEALMRKPTLVDGAVVSDRPVPIDSPVRGTGGPKLVGYTTQMYTGSIYQSTMTSTEQQQQQQQNNNNSSMIGGPSMLGGNTATPMYPPMSPNDRSGANLFTSGALSPEKRPPQLMPIKKPLPALGGAGLATPMGAGSGGGGGAGAGGGANGGANGVANGGANGADGDGKGGKGGGKGMSAGKILGISMGWLLATILLIILGFIVYHYGVAEKSKDPTASDYTSLTERVTTAQVTVDTFSTVMYPKTNYVNLASGSGKQYALSLDATSTATGEVLRVRPETLSEGGIRLVSYGTASSTRAHVVRSAAKTAKEEHEHGFAALQTSAAASGDPETKETRSILQSVSLKLSSSGGLAVTAGLTQFSGDVSAAGNFSAKTLFGTTLNTGQGNNTLYPMDQGVRAADNVTFASLKLGGSGGIVMQPATASAARIQFGASDTVLSLQGTRSLRLTGGLALDADLSAGGNFSTQGNANVSGSLNVGQTLLSANLTTKRVGINVASPSATLHVGGSVTVDGQLIVNGQISIPGISARDAVARTICLTGLSQGLSSISSFVMQVVQYNITDTLENTCSAIGPTGAWHACGVARPGLGLVGSPIGAVADCTQRLEVDLRSTFVKTSDWESYRANMTQCTSENVMVCCSPTCSNW